MRRVLPLFLALFVLAAGAAWLADHPGRVVVDWRDWRIETSVAVLATAVAALMAAAAALARLWRWLRAGPGLIGGARAETRRRRGYQALGEGLVAVAAGDSGQAGRLAKRAAALLDEPPLTLLLGAQAAQLAGEEGTARRSFEAMLEHPETEFLGLRGLLAQARREGDAEAALSLARRARDLRPDAPWVLDTLFDLETAAGNWGPAEEVLGQATRLKLVSADEGRRRRALVLMGRARTAQAGGDAAAALEAALGARKAAPELVPATALAARLLAAGGKVKRAEKLLQEGWRARPHPDLLAAYQAVDEDATPEARLAGFRKLSAARAGDPESLLALAGLALAAGRWDEARAELHKLGAAADARAYLLAAALEEQAGDGEAARAALARAAAAPPGPAWLCRACGRASAEWAPRCAACGGFDDLDWTAREGTGEVALPVPVPAVPALEDPPAGQDLVEPAVLPEEGAAPEGSALPAPATGAGVPPPPDIPAAPGPGTRPTSESSG